MVAGFDVGVLVGVIDGLGHGPEAAEAAREAARVLEELKRPAEALAAGRMAHALLLREGDEICVFRPLALCTALRGRLVDAARIHGFVDAKLARSGVLTESGWTRAPERLDALLSAGLSAEELTRLKATGAMMREAQVLKLAFGDDI